MNEQQQHLANLTNQKDNLLNEVSQLQTEIDKRREIFLKVQGAIEYLNTIGVTLPETTEEGPGEEVTEEEAEQVAAEISD
jgi:uncharacterized protein YlxW (UPF0749 family)